jgi:4-amino-4-deoxy-L-arabinose transferase-like glycosyltransferase
MAGNQPLEQAPPTSPAPAARNLQRLTVGLLVLVVVFAVAVRLYAATRIPASFDEGIYAYGGWEWICDGGLLYRDLAENKPPLVYLTYGTLIKLGGPGLLPTRVAGTLALLLTGLLVGLLARQMGYRYGAGLAGLVCAAFLLSPSLDSPYALTEPFMILAVAGMFLVAYRSRNQALPWGLAAAGVLGGIGFLYKQVALLEVAALSVWILLRLGRPRGRSWGELGAFWVGFVLPPLASVAWASHAGILADYRYCCFGPLLTSIAPPTLGGRLTMLAVSVNQEWQLLLTYLGALVFLCVRPGARESRRLLSLWVVAGLVGPFIGSAYGHQFLEAGPPLALATVLVFLWLGHRLGWERLGEEQELLRGVRALVLFAAVFGVWVQLPLLRDALTLEGRNHVVAAEATLAKLVASRSSPQDTLLPWANSLAHSCLLINVQSGRRSPTRWVTGDPGALPGAGAEFQRALTQAPPRFVVTAGVVPSAGPAPPAERPSALDAWVAHLVSTQYRLVTTADRYALYERARPAGSDRTQR